MDRQRGGRREGDIGEARAREAQAEVEALLWPEGGEDPGPEALEQAVELTRRAAGWARAADNADAEGELEYLAGIALAQLGDPEAALHHLDAARRAIPDAADVDLERGQILLDLRRYAEAKEALTAALSLEPELSGRAAPAGRPARSGEPQAGEDGLEAEGDAVALVASAHHALGLLAERTGELAAAERHLARARALDPEGFPAPVRLSPAEAEAVLEEALTELPEPVRAWLANVVITLEDLPSDEDLAGSDPPLPPTILGLFRGSSLGDKASMDPWSHFPSSIAIYQRNLERAARDREELVEELRVTLLHEVGHFLGLDEEGLAARGLE